MGSVYFENDYKVNLIHMLGYLIGDACVFN